MIIAESRNVYPWFCALRERPVQEYLKCFKNLSHALVFHQSSRITCSLKFGAFQLLTTCLLSASFQSGKKPPFCRSNWVGFWARQRTPLQSRKGLTNVFDEDRYQPCAPKVALSGHHWKIYAIVSLKLRWKQCKWCQGVCCQYHLQRNQGGKVPN